MPVNSTPISGRVRFTYPDSFPDLRINGINPECTPTQLVSLADAIQSIQTRNIRHGYLIAESELQEG